MAPPSNRLRTRRACEACKVRKRKCNGQDPCSSCVRYEYGCQYTLSSSRRGKKPNSEGATRSLSESAARFSLQQSLQSSTNHQLPISPQSQQHTISSEEQRLDVSPAIAFAQDPVLTVDVGHPPKVQGFGWNLGLHYHYQRSEKTITSIVSENQWQLLFEMFLKKIAPVYGFVDTQTVLRESSHRWQDHNANNSYDHMLCGVAALGSLFLPAKQRSDDQERLLVECAKEILETSSMVREPTIIDAQAWLLRLLFLRFSSPPHAAWMASCTAMHIVEAIGLHQEPADQQVNSVDNVDLSANSNTDETSNIEPQSADIRRRIYWAAKLLNSWMAVEYNRSRVVLRNTTCRLPTLVDGDSTSNMIRMFQLSEILCPKEIVPDTAELENCLRELTSYEFTFDHVIMSQANLAFAFYRRLSISNHNNDSPRIGTAAAAAAATVDSDLLNRVISLGRKGLAASQRACVEGSPWWHTSNVPFQFTCVLLAMDTKESLSLVKESLDTLRFVSSTFKTPMARSALETIQQLVQFAMKKKEQDAALLARSLQPGVISGLSTYPVVQNPFGNSNIGSIDNNLGQSSVDMLANISWPNGFLLHDPTLGDIDWDGLCPVPFDFTGTQQHEAYRF